ncbi:hypothetical protein K8R04_03860 [Candidatus Uhrbacteria bacterium]|nr:hypothetical protein [Candidatus Uhrbacteria bacterium]
MESQHTEPVKTHGFFKTFLIAVLACIVVLALVIGGFIAYLVYANPKILQGDPTALLKTKVLLESAGVKTPTMPTTVTSQQEACAVAKLGQARVNEIKAGASISASDIAAAGSCF